LSLVVDLLKKVLPLKADDETEKKASELDMLESILA
jgi:hypothetical protein